MSGTREGSSGGSGSVRGGVSGGGGGGSTSGVAGSLADLDDTSQSGSAHNVSSVGGGGGGNAVAVDPAPQPQSKTSAFPKLSLPGIRGVFVSSLVWRSVFCNSVCLDDCFIVLVDWCIVLKRGRSARWGKRRWRKRRGGGGGGNAIINFLIY